MLQLFSGYNYHGEQATHSQIIENAKREKSNSTGTCYWLATHAEEMLIQLQSLFV